MTHDGVPPIAPVPDLSDPTGIPDGPPPAAEPLRDISPWDGAGMTAHLEASARASANRAARRAARIQTTGRGVRAWHASIHAAVLDALAAAETAAPAADRPWHASRLDAYAAAYGLRGWYRYTNHHGKHAVQVNRIRTHMDGNHGRYYTARHAPRGSVMNPGPYTHCVVDRDTQRTVYEAIAPRIAHQWIKEHEAA
ncbi:hypothetical protein [Streptomyces sp. NPDC001970]